MPSRLSNKQAENSLDVRFGAVASSAPATYYFAICTTAPTDNDGAGLVEPSGGAYARVAVTNNATNFPAAAARLKSSGTAITWPTASASWGTAVGIAWFNHVSNTGATVFCGYAALGSSVPIGSGATPQIAAGNFQVGSSGS